VVVDSRVAASGELGVVTQLPAVLPAWLGSKPARGAKPSQQHSLSGTLPHRKWGGAAPLFTSAWRSSPRLQHTDVGLNAAQKHLADRRVLLQEVLRVAGADGALDW
jgi:hypothetical protein